MPLRKLWFALEGLVIAAVLCGLAASLAEAALVFVARSRIAGQSVPRKHPRDFLNLTDCGEDHRLSGFLSNMIKSSPAPANQN